MKYWIYKMWSHIIILVYLTIPWTIAQRDKTVRHFHNSHGWDIRLAVPGEPGNDYPVLNSIPKTSFSCARKSPGYYADVETNCQVFRVCTLGSTFSFQSFLCPNGTLFNQAVFVCDWWMNVKCAKSAQYYNNNEKYANLKIGPQLMVDVKNMLTHSMRNPYDKIVTNNNVVVMQEYKPPSVQAEAHNGYNFENTEHNLDQYYVYDKQPSKIFNHNIFNTDTFTASTIAPRYISTFNAFPPSALKQIEKYHSPNYLSEHLHRSHNVDSFFNSKNSQNTQKPIQYSRQLQQNQYSTTNNGKILNSQRHFGNDFIANHKPQADTAFREIQNQNHNQFSQAYTQIGKQSQQNSVSIDVPSTVITKTLTYRRIIQNPKQGQPRSRITLKKWIVKPSRSARLTSETTPYTYNIPSGAENFVAENSYFYNKPNSEYTNRPSEITSNKQTLKTRNNNERLITSPTRPIPTVPSRLYLNPVTNFPTKPSLLYLPPTTYKPASLLYIPPSESSKLVSLQNKESSDLIQSNYESKKFETPLYSLTKQSYLNAKHRNLTFSDILTKDKLDISVNDIVKDTNKIIQTEALKQTNDIKQNIEISENYYLPPEADTISENLSPEPSMELSKSSRLIASPSTELELPLETFNNLGPNSNPVSNLPFIKESVLPTNTIERTVSLRITIPEKVADLLFKNQSIAQSDNLEILNTGNSNYIVFNKKNTDKLGNNNIIPVVKLSWNDNSNVSNSQDLVLSLLADSISSAKQYTQIVKQEHLASKSTPETLQNYKSADLGHLTSRISDLTSSQYSKNNKSFAEKGTSDSKQSKTSEYSYINRQQIPSSQKQERLVQAEQSTSPDSDVENFQINSKKIYSGQLYQLPVPVVTQQIYNAPIKSTTNARTYLQKQNLSQNLKNNNIIQTTQASFVTIDNKNKAVQNYLRSEAYEQESLNEEFDGNNEITENIKGSENRISAHINDKTIGTIQHPLQDNKVISYKKDKSFILFSQLNNNDVNHNNDNSFSIQNLPLGNDLSSYITFQLIPSISYKLENEKQKQNILNAFKIDEQGRPKETKNVISQNPNIRQMSADLVYSVDQENLEKTSQDNNLNTLYDGPSSYLAPQLSIGSLDTTQSTETKTLSTEVDDLNSNENNSNGYPKVTPSKRFLF